MIDTNTFSIQKVEKSRISEIDFDHLDFGKYVSDHMFTATYENGEWQNPEIKPFGAITMAPTALALHYGQTVFEGMKAFRMKDGNISIFRLDSHYDRFCKSMERMCIPVIPFQLFADGIKALVELDKDWVPSADGASLYLRPFVFASEERFGVKISDEYKFIIFAGPVGPYYVKPLRVKVEDHYIRAAHGGTGFAKCAGNYGGAFYPTKKAKEEGFDQVLWTDGSPELNIEESGTMNVMFVIENTLCTPPLSDSILNGITRDSYLHLAKDLGINAKEYQLNAQILIDAFKDGTIKEAFGVGTAAVAAPIQTINIKGKDYDLPKTDANSFSQRAKKLLTDIRTGVSPDKYNWNTILKEN